MQGIAEGYTLCATWTISGRRICCENSPAGSYLEGGQSLAETPLLDYISARLQRKIVIKAFSIRQLHRVLLSQRSEAESPIKSAPAYPGTPVYHLLLLLPCASLIVNTQCHDSNYGSHDAHQHDTASGQPSAAHDFSAALNSSVAASDYRLYLQRADPRVRAKPLLPADCGWQDAERLRALQGRIHHFH